MIDVARCCLVFWCLVFVVVVCDSRRCWLLLIVCWLLPYCVVCVWCYRALLMFDTSRLLFDCYDCLAVLLFVVVLCLIGVVVYVVVCVCLFVVVVCC